MLIMKKIYFVVILLAAICSNVFAQPRVIFRQIRGGLNNPLDVVSAGDGSKRLFIVEKGGTIRVIKNDVMLDEPFIDITGHVVSDGERGLLSLVFHPNFKNNKTFFIYFNNVAGEVTLVRLRTRADNPDRADETTAKVLLTIPKPTAIHNGAKLNFGADGYLYFATGDGGGGGDPFNSAQDGSKLLGKMLRINVDNIEVPPYYTIPPTNPYISVPGVRPEIYAGGLRNPYRWSFDRLTHDMWIGDVGEGQWEEVNFRPAANTAATNFGWRCYEGTHAFNLGGCLPESNYTHPIFEYHHDTTGGFAVTGGYVFRDPLFPQLNGWYLTTDHITGHLWKIRSNGAGGWTIVRQPKALSFVSAFGEGEDGDLYAVTLTGLLYRVEAAFETPLPVTLSNFAAQQGTGGINLTWQTSFEQNLKQFEIEYSDNNVEFVKAGIVAARNSINGETYSFLHTGYNKTRIYYRLKMVDLDGTVEYSRTITLDIPVTATNYIANISSNGTIALYLAESFDNVQVVDLQGKVLLKQPIRGRTGKIEITLPSSVTGTVVVRLDNADRKKNFARLVIVR